MPQNYVTLNDGATMPQIGFGTFQIPPEETAAAVREALDVGYRAMDTAAAYRNEAGVGEGIDASGLARDDVFVTTKLWNNSHGRDAALEAFEKSLGRLGMDAVDLYLIHWPVPSRDLFVETWQALTELQAEGRARSIGVSNFRIEDLERIIDASGVVPAVNQIELHPQLQQAELRAFHAEHGIATTAWSPLAQGNVLANQAVIAIAREVGRTEAQVILRWHLQIGNIVIPKSVTPQRIAENFAIDDFELDDEAMEQLALLDGNERIGPDPGEFART